MTQDPVWTREQDGWMDRRPIVVGEQLFVRSGGHTMALSCATGDTEWSTLVDPRDDTGQFFVLSAGALITSRSKNDRTVVVATNLTGDLLWEIETGVIIVDAWAASDTEFLAFGGAGGDYVFHRIDSTTGEVLTRETLPWLPDQIRFVGDRLVGAKRDVPGLVTFDDDGLATHHFCQDPVYGILVQEPHTVITALVDDQPRLRRLSPALDVLWDQPAATTAFATDAATIACVARSNADAVELLDADSGETIWQSDSLTGEAVQFAVYDHVVEARGLTMLSVLDRRDGSLIGEHLMGSSVVATGAGGYVVTAMKSLSLYKNPQD